MFGFRQKKYELRWPQKRMITDQNGSYEANVFRIQALRDIPEHGVKAGDTGGFVSSYSNLSQSDSCWIADDAEVLNNASVIHNAFVGGNASVITSSPAAWSKPIYVMNNARIIDEAVIRNYTSTPQRKMQISGNVVISGSAYVENVGFISDSAKVYDEARLKGCNTIGANSEIFGHAILYSSVEILGESKICGNVVINNHVLIRNSTLAGSLMIPQSSRIEDFICYEQDKLDRFILEKEVKALNARRGKRNDPFRDRLLSEILDGLHQEDGKPVPIWTAESLNDEMDRIVRKYYHDPKSSLVQNRRSVPPSIPLSAMQGQEIINAQEVVPIVIKSSEHARAIAAYEEILVSLEAYEKDIVKIIKYPTMMDPNDPKTLALKIAFKTAKRLYEENQCPVEELIKAIKDLEEKFVIAEFNARKISQTALSESEKKKLQKAQDLLAIAANEASSEQEKKSAFTQGFKQLEGVLVVPKEAMDAFRIKYNLREITS